MRKMYFFLMFVVLMFAICPLFGQVSPGVRNVLMIVVDDLRPELGPYRGTDEALFPGIQTPHIDGLAASSLVFTKAYSQYALCGPSRSSFLTGRRPDTTKVMENSPYWRETGGNFSSMPQYFKENGYSTYASGKLFHSNDDNEFSWTENNYRSTTGDFWRRDGQSWGIADPTVVDIIPLPSMQIRDYALDKLRETANESEPFFLAVGFLKPHLPFLAPQEFFEMYPVEDIYLPDNRYVPDNFPEISWTSWNDLYQYDDIQEFNNGYNQSLPDYKTLDLRRGYYAAVSYTDSLVGELLEELSVLGLDDTTAVLFMADHGFHLGEHSDWAKRSNMELDTRVPAMLKIPGITDNGGNVDEFVELVDVFPTLVDVVGLDPVSLCPENSSMVNVCHEGRSILDSLSSNEWKDATFSQMVRDDIIGYSIHTSQYNYVRWMPVLDADFNVDWNNVTAEELYDLQEDPNQTVNVSEFPEYADMQVEANQRLLSGWRAALP